MTRPCLFPTCQCSGGICDAARRPARSFFTHVAEPVLIGSILALGFITVALFFGWSG